MNNHFEIVTSDHAIMWIERWLTVDPRYKENSRIPKCYFTKLIHKNNTYTTAGTWWNTYAGKYTTFIIYTIPRLLDVINNFFVLIAVTHCSVNMVKFREPPYHHSLGNHFIYNCAFSNGFTLLLDRWMFSYIGFCIII